MVNKSIQLEDFKRDLRNLLEKHNATIGYEWSHGVTGLYDAYIDVAFGDSPSEPLTDDHYVSKENI